MTLKLYQNHIGVLVKNIPRDWFSRFGIELRNCIFTKPSALGDPGTVGQYEFENHWKNNKWYKD